MNGKSGRRGRLWFSGIAVAVLLAAAVATPADADPGISCDYRFTAWTGGFSADLSIFNAGPAIDGWTVRMTFPTATRLTGVWRASMSQSSPYEATATSFDWDALIGTGRMTSFGWTASATDTGKPTAVSVNDVAC